MECTVCQLGIEIVVTMRNLVQVPHHGAPVTPVLGNRGRRTKNKTKKKEIKEDARHALASAHAHTQVNPTTLDR